MESRISSKDNNKQKIHILVAEDDAYQRLALIDILALNDYEVTAVENGRLARDELLNEDNEFNLVLLDLMMPEMDGYELLCLIKSQDKFKDIPVIMMSSDGEMQIVANCMSQGAVDYIIKPIRLQNVKGFEKHVVVKNSKKNQQHNSLAVYQNIKLLGRGAAGNVDLVKRNTDGQYFALKVIPMHFMSKEEKKQAENEITLLKVLNGPTIIRYYESFIENDSIHIVMEYAEKGAVSDLIQEFKQRGQSFDSEQILYWMGQILLGIMLMHSKNILHRDIKTQNMFLSSDDVIKLGDFGIAKALGTQNQFAKTFLGTPYFMAPEVCNGQVYGQKADVWAIGCALYEMVTHRRPFQADQLQKVFEMIINKEPDPLPEDTDEDIKLLVELMLQKDPNHRPSIWNLAEMQIIKTNIIKFAEKYNCSDSVENLYPNIYAQDNQDKQQIAETINKVKSQKVQEQVKQMNIKIEPQVIQEQTEIDLQSLKDKVKSELKKKKIKVSFFKSVQNAFSGEMLFDFISDKYPNFPLNQIVKICDILMEQKFIVPYKPIDQFSRSSSAIYTFETESDTQNTNQKQKQEKKSRSNQQVDNSADKIGNDNLQKIENEHDYQKGAVKQIEQVVDICNELLDDIADKFVNIYNIPSEYFDSLMMIDFYVQIYKLQDVDLNDLQQYEQKIFFTNLIQVMFLHQNLKKQQFSLKLIQEEKNSSMSKKVMNKLIYYLFYFPNFEQYQKQKYQTIDLISVNYKIKDQVFSIDDIIDCILFEGNQFQQSAVKILKFFFLRQNDFKNFKQDTDVRLLYIFNQKYRYPLQLKRFDKDNLENILNQEYERFIDNQIHYDKTEKQFIFPQVFEKFISYFGQNQKTQIENIFKFMGNQKFKFVMNKINETRFCFQRNDWSMILESSELIDNESDSEFKQID